MYFVQLLPYYFILMILSFYYRTISKVSVKEKKWNKSWQDISLNHQKMFFESICTIHQENIYYLWIKSIISKHSQQKSHHDNNYMYYNHLPSSFSHFSIQLSINFQQVHFDFRQMLKVIQIFKTEIMQIIGKQIRWLQDLCLYIIAQKLGWKNNFTIKKILIRLHHYV